MCRVSEEMGRMMLFVIPAKAGIQLDGCPTKAFGHDLLFQGIKEWKGYLSAPRLAGTARLNAQASIFLICSAMVTDKGTVRLMASMRSC